MNVSRETLKRGCRILNISCSWEDIEKLARFTEELICWNRKINLISRKEKKVVEKIILPSLIPANILRGDVLDFGSGGGIPGVPLSILCKGAKFYLLEANRKKCVFLFHVKHKILCSFDVINKRAEEWREGFGSFDFVLLRGIRINPIPFKFLRRKGTLVYYGREKGEIVETPFGAVTLISPSR